MAAGLENKGYEGGIIMQFKRRDGLLSSIFGVLTCGLYSIYFWYQYGEDVNVICAEDGKTTQNFIVAWLLGIITCGIYSLYWMYMLASRLDTASKKYGVNVESPVFFTLFMNIPFLSYFYACDVMNKFQEKYEEMYPNGNGYGGNGYGNNVPPVSPYNGGSGNTMQSMGAQIGAQFKSAVQDMGNSIKNTAQSAMPSCKNCGAAIPPGKNYCKRCGYPVNGPAPQESSYRAPGNVPPMGQEFQRNQTPPMPRTSAGFQSSPVLEMPESRQDTFDQEAALNLQTPEAAEMTGPASEQNIPVCPKCGNAVKPGDRFCIHCGSKIE